MSARGCATIAPWRLGSATSAAAGAGRRCYRHRRKPGFPKSPGTLCRVSMLGSRNRRSVSWHASLTVFV